MPSLDRSILLLDGGHMDAMVSGLVPPDELFGLVLDHASFYGQTYPCLLDLLAPAVPAQVVTVPSAHEAAITQLRPGVAYRPVCSVAGADQLGMAPAGRGKVLVSAVDGIAEIDRIKGTAAWRVAVSDCHGPAVLRADGAIMFTRRHGVAVAADGELAVVAGGFCDRSSLFTGPDATVWLLDPINDAINLVAPTIVCIGDLLGEEELHPAGRHQWPVAAAWLDDTRLALVLQPRDEILCGVARRQGTAVG